MAASRNGNWHADRRNLSAGWECCCTTAGLYAKPEDLPRNLSWMSAAVPGTAAAALRSAGAWSLDGPRRRFDADDWWFRVAPEFTDEAAADIACLAFDGLATLCDVWLNGSHILHSENMFLEHRIDRPPFTAGRNELILRFGSLDQALRQKRRRPRWRAPMVENQQLRWYRTTLLGRTPGWSPPAAAVGPWRAVWVGTGGSVRPAVERLTCKVQDGSGLVQLLVRVESPADDPPAWQLQLRDSGKIVATQDLHNRPDGLMDAELSVRDPRLWWPHTHGRPHLYEIVMCRKGGSANAPEHSLGRVGFRTVSTAAGPGKDFAVHVNDVQVFCRGACWTPLDVVSLGGDEAGYRRAIEQAVDAGFNMLRVGGTMVYEDELFFDLCDEYGVLVWQDFMFANMDYPAEDADLGQSIAAEARQQLRRWMRHPSVAVICGNSEVSQQAAMWGAPRALWEPALFSQTLAQLTAAHCPGVAYWPSSASGGAIPHQPSAGTTSYYGLGAYLRSADDLRRSGLNFATECLAFANIPEDTTLQSLPGGAGVRVTHAAWRERSPRDLGAGWDFDDVRDHYVAEFFGVDPGRLRYHDHARYVALGREASAHAMTTAFTEWRRPGSSCGGALIWFLRDLWPGAGWGIIDSAGNPKTPYHALRRTLQPVWVGITDEGLNGLSVHLRNESPIDRSGTLELLLYRAGRHLIEHVNHEQPLPARSMRTIALAELLDTFHDLTFAYRFGPMSCDLVIARWRDPAAPDVASESCYLPDSGLHIGPDASIGLSARARELEPGLFEVTLNSGAFVRGVNLQADGYSCDDSHFWLAPGQDRRVQMRAVGAPRPLFGVVSALNLAAPARIEIVGNAA